MPVTKIIRGDLLKMFHEGKFDTIGHGANCQNVMGSGIAAQIREQISQAYVADTEFFERMGGEDHKPNRLMGGQISVGNIVDGDKHKRVVNMYTQVPMGRNGDYQLLQNACQNLNRYCKGRSIQRVGLPMVGAGIAGLDPMAVATIINACTPDIDVTLVIYTKDDKMWKIVAGGFNNFGFPRVFDGVVVALKNSLFSIYDQNTGKWIERGYGCLKDVKVMTDSGEHAITFSDNDPAIYRLFYRKADAELFLKK